MHSQEVLLSPHLLSGQQSSSGLKGKHRASRRKEKFQVSRGVPLLPSQGITLFLIFFIWETIFLQVIRYVCNGCELCFGARVLIFLQFISETTDTQVLFKTFSTQSLEEVSCRGHCAIMTLHFARSRFPRISVQEPASTPNTFTQTKVSCINGQGNAIASNMTNNEAVLKRARLGFSEEVAFGKQDQDISLVKALLLISAEDEAFMSLNREKDRLAAHTEGRSFSEPQSEACGPDVEGFPIAGRTMPTWLARFDFLAKEVEDILATRGSSPKPVEVLKAVGTVLFEIQGFKRSVTDLDTRSFYLHLVLTLGSGSGMLLCIIYMEVCRRLGVIVKGAEVGDELLMWPLVDNLQECYEHYGGGKSWFLELLAFHHPKHLFSNLGPSTHGSFTSPTLKFASNKDIVGMVLSKLKNLHWKDACKARPGFTLTDPLHPLVYANGRLTDHTELAVGALLRPRNLRLALMASERLRLLHPRSWILMRDHGLLLYHSRRYGEAVQELSICAALAPTVERHMLEHFVEKLHLLRIESSWSSLRPPSAPSTLA